MMKGQTEVFLDPLLWGRRNQGLRKTGVPSEEQGRCRLPGKNHSTSLFELIRPGNFAWLAGQILDASQFSGRDVQKIGPKERASRCEIAARFKLRFQLLQRVGFQEPASFINV